MTRHVRTLCILAVLGLIACDESSVIGGGPESLDAQLRRQFTQWNIVPIGEAPHQDPAMVALGQALMFDKILSGNRDIACATCHDPTQNLTDGLALAGGTGGHRSAVGGPPGAGGPVVAR